MALKLFFHEQFMHFNAFLDGAEEVVRCLRVDPEIKELFIKALIRMDADPSVPHLFCCSDLPFAGSDNYCLGLHQWLRDEYQALQPELAECALPPLVEEGFAPDSTPFQRLLRYTGGLAENLCADGAALVLVLDPETIGDREAFADLLTRLAAASRSPRCKFLVLDRRVDPLPISPDIAPGRISVQDFYLAPEEMERRAVADLARPLLLTSEERRQYLGLVAGFAYGRKDYQQAAALQQQWIELAAAEGSPAEEASAWHNLGNSRLALGDLDGAEDAFTHAAQLCLEHSLDQLLPLAMTNLGVVLYRSGEAADAVRSLEITRAFFSAQGQKPGEAYALDTLAGIYADAGLKDQAERTWQEAIGCYQEVSAETFADARAAGIRDIEGKIARLREPPLKSGAAQAADTAPLIAVSALAMRNMMARRADAGTAPSGAGVAVGAPAGGAALGVSPEPSAPRTTPEWPPRSSAGDARELEGSRFDPGSEQGRRDSAFDRSAWESDRNKRFEEHERGARGFGERGRGETSLEDRGRGERGFGDRDLPDRDLGDRERPKEFGRDREFGRNRADFERDRESGDDRGVGRDRDFDRDRLDQREGRDRRDHERDSRDRDHEGRDRERERRDRDHEGRDHERKRRDREDRERRDREDRDLERRDREGRDHGQRLERGERRRRLLDRAERRADHLAERRRRDREEGRGQPDPWSQDHGDRIRRLRELVADPAAALDRLRGELTAGLPGAGPGPAQLASILAQLDALRSQLGRPPRPSGVLARIGAAFAFLIGIEQMLSTFLSMIPFPAFPALRITDLDVGLPHAHNHPPNLTPPNPVPVPLPSTGPIIPIPFLSGASRTLINGMPAARCGDLGLGLWCGGYFPMYEVFLGSSSVWIEGARAGRLAIDITKHCTFSSPKPSDPPMGPMVGVTTTASMNVMIGGVPMPSLLSLAFAAALKALFSGLAKAVQRLRRVGAAAAAAPSAPAAPGAAAGMRGLPSGYHPPQVTPRVYEILDSLPRMDVDGERLLIAGGRIDLPNGISAGELAALTNATGREFGVVVNGGRLQLVAGAADHVPVEAADNVLVHTHPEPHYTYGADISRGDIDRAAYDAAQHGFDQPRAVIDAEGNVHHYDGNGIVDQPVLSPIQQNGRIDGLYTSPTGAPMFAAPPGIL